MLWGKAGRFELKFWSARIRSIRGKIPVSSPPSHRRTPVPCLSRLRIQTQPSRRLRPQAHPLRPRPSRGPVLSTAAPVSAPCPQVRAHLRDAVLHVRDDHRPDHVPRHAHSRAAPRAGCAVAPPPVRPRGAGMCTRTDGPGNVVLSWKLCCVWTRLERSERLEFDFMLRSCKIRPGQVDMFFVLLSPVHLLLESEKGF